MQSCWSICSSQQWAECYSRSMSHAVSSLIRGSVCYKVLFLLQKGALGFLVPLTNAWGEDSMHTCLNLYAQKEKDQTKKMCLVHENREHFMSLVLWDSCSVVSVCGKSGKTVIPVAQTLGSLFCVDGQGCVASQHWGLRPLLQRELLQGRKLLLKLEEKPRKATGGGIAEQDAIQCLLSVELQVLCSIMHFLVRRKKKMKQLWSWHLCSKDFTTFCLYQSLSYFLSSGTRLSPVVLL